MHPAVVSRQHGRTYILNDIMISVSYKIQKNSTVSWSLETSQKNLDTQQKPFDSSQLVKVKVSRYVCNKHNNIFYMNVFTLKMNKKDKRMAGQKW